MKYKFPILFIFLTFSFSDLEISTPGDINNDGVIDGGSIQDYISHWGHSAREVGTLTDLDKDGTVGN